LGIGDWAQSPIPNPQSPIPNPQSPFIFPRKKQFYLIIIILKLKIIIKKINKKSLNSFQSKCRTRNSNQ
jgi:hypothetical protein